MLSVPFNARAASPSFRCLEAVRVAASIVLAVNLLCRETDSGLREAKDNDADKPPLCSSRGYRIAGPTRLFPTAAVKTFGPVHALHCPIARPAVDVGVLNRRIDVSTRLAAYLLPFHA